jgi:hypothetical protein
MDKEQRPSRVNGTRERDASAHVPQSAALNEFLVRFSDDVRALRDPRAVARVASRRVVEELDTEEAHGTEIDRTTPSTSGPRARSGPTILDPAPGQTLRRKY